MFSSLVWVADHTNAKETIQDLCVACSDTTVMYQKLKDVGNGWKDRAEPLRTFGE